MDSTSQLSAKKLKTQDFPAIECFHSRDYRPYWFTARKGSICIKIEFNSQRFSLGHQHGRRDVMWKHSINGETTTSTCRSLFSHKRVPCLLALLIVSAKWNPRGLVKSCDILVRLARHNCFKQNGILGYPGAVIPAIRLTAPGSPRIAKWLNSFTGISTLQ